MQKSFHYYGTYCAAYLAGYSHEESLEICYSAQLVDWCSRLFLADIHAPLAAATTQLPSEMAAARNNPFGTKDVTRIWASFHFLPRDLYADPGKGGKRYQNKYRMICGPNGSLLVDTVNLAKDKSLQAAGIAMHVLADTWAHQYFAGTPSLVINNTSRFFVELVPAGLLTEEPQEKQGRPKRSDRIPSKNLFAQPLEGRFGGGDFVERTVKFRHNPTAEDDLDAGIYTNSIFQAGEESVMNLGHGRAGHLPDLSFARYRYLPAWGGYEEIFKDNPSDFYHAFTQMVYALKYLNGQHETFEVDTYDALEREGLEASIKSILEKRQPESGALEDWNALAEQLSGCTVPPFDLDAYRDEYCQAPDKDKESTTLGKFILAALAQKGMLVNRVYASGNPLAGRSVDFDEKGLSGMRDYFSLVPYLRKGDGNG